MVSYLVCKADRFAEGWNIIYVTACMVTPLALGTRGSFGAYSCADVKRVGAAGRALQRCMSSACCVREYTADRLRVRAENLDSVRIFSLGERS